MIGDTGQVTRLFVRDEFGQYRPIVVIYMIGA